jgi:hypothetical protein
VVSLKGGRRNMALPYVVPTRQVASKPAKPKEKPAAPAAPKGSRPEKRAASAR